ncbi:unnamed protein product, partial [Ixodes pacificus]
MIVAIFFSPLDLFFFPSFDQIGIFGRRLRRIGLALGQLPSEGARAEARHGLYESESLRTWSTSDGSRFPSHSRVSGRTTDKEGGGGDYTPIPLWPFSGIFTGGEPASTFQRFSSRSNVAGAA